MDTSHLRLDKEVEYFFHVHDVYAKQKKWKTLKDAGNKALNKAMALNLDEKAAKIAFLMAKYCYLFLDTTLCTYYLKKYHEINPYHKYPVQHLTLALISARRREKAFHQQAKRCALLATAAFVLMLWCHK